MRTVVVTGVAGTVGSRVGEALRAGGTRVVGVDLPGAFGERAFGERAFGEGAFGEGAFAEGAEASRDTVALDLAGADTGSLAEALAGADAVIHLAWRIPETTNHRRRRREADEREANEENVRAVNQVLDGAERAGVPFVILVSSATVYGAWADNPVPLSEDARLRPNPAFAYAVGKAEAERLLAEWAEQHPETTVAVLRPAVMVGGAGRPLYQALGGTRAPRGADGARPVQYLHVDDLASALLVVLERGAGGVFNVAPDTGIPEDTARSLAGGVAKLALPSRLAGAVAAWSWDLWRSGIPKEALPYLTHPWVIASDRLRAQGWRPRYTSEEALVATDVRQHWDDLPPGRRQGYLVAAILGGGVVVVGGGVAAVLAIRRRRI